ncbi:hypothetical protein GCM10028804_04850 [Larkinella terrae]
MEQQSYVCFAKQLFVGKLICKIGKIPPKVNSRKGANPDMEAGITPKPASDDSRKYLAAPGPNELPKRYSGVIVCFLDGL